jgi:copper chaperone CopZ
VHTGWPLSPGWKGIFPVQTELLRITGMTCGGCSSKVTHALKAVSGVREVKVELSAGEATMQYDERLASATQLKSAVTSAGYRVM